MFPQRWIKETNVMGIISKSGNNGGTYAHPDIAIERIFKMKRKIIIISCISLLAIAILVICINLHTMPTEALTKEEAIELMKKVENYNNIHITTYMDKNNSLTAHKVVNEYSYSDLVRIFREYGEEKFATSIAHEIVAKRTEKAIETTFELAEIIRQSIPSFQKGKDKATRCFQALRIHINQELFQLESVLPQTINLLKTGGRLVIISFHSSNF